VKRLNKARRSEISTLLPVAYDGAGRMVLPPFLRSEAGIGDTALFLGLGDYFEIWNPLKAREALADDPMLVRMIDYLSGPARMTRAQPLMRPMIRATHRSCWTRSSPGSRLSGEVHVDGTFGAGGYTRALLASGARVIAFDRDPDAIAEGQWLVADASGRLTSCPSASPRWQSALEALGLDAVDGVTLDIGVSSMQLDRAERGFSFQADGPLDMRMEQDGMSAADFCNEADEADIADVLYTLGEERQSRRVARAIVAARPIETTGQLAGIVRKALGYREHDKKDPATRTFQAIRIHLNRELEELEDGLAAAERVLKPGGRLAIVSFHSLEDRIVKRFLKERSGATPAGSRHLPDGRGRACAQLRGGRQAGEGRRGRACPQSPFAFRHPARRPAHGGQCLGPRVGKVFPHDRAAFSLDRMGCRLRRRRPVLLPRIAVGGVRAGWAGEGGSRDRVDDERHSPPEHGDCGARAHGPDRALEYRSAGAAGAGARPVRRQRSAVGEPGGRQGSAAGSGDRRVEGCGSYRGLSG
jgi:16S rRNA (cytosine1402-N4)-methyltransferase